MSMKDEKMRQPQKPLKKTDWLLLGFFAILFLWILFPREYPARYRGSFIACKQALEGIKTGIEMVLGEGGLLKNIDPHGDQVCHRIVAGYNEAKECENLGLVKKRVTSVCHAGYKINILDDSRFEITGVSKDTHNIRICVTETTVTPKDYNEGMRNPNGTQCRH